MTGRNHAHREAEHPYRVGPSVDQVAQQNRGSTVGMCSIDRPAVGVARDGIAELSQQSFKFEAAPVNVADGIERSGEMPKVVVETLPNDDSGVDVIGRFQNVNGAEPFALQSAKPPSKIGCLPMYDVFAKGAVGTFLISRCTKLFWQVEHDGHRQPVVGARKGDQVLARRRLHVRGVDDGEPPRR